MKYVFCCPKCGGTFDLDSPESEKICSDCKLPVLYTGCADEAWSKLPPKERQRIKMELKSIGPDAVRKWKEEAEARRREAEERQRETLERRREAMQIEEEKQAFAKSFNEFYEYEVVTVRNDRYGAVDRDFLMRVLAQYAQNGWRLHTAYSNQLGVNSSSSYGSGTNSTICEDVLIFERRVEKLS